MNSTQRRFQLNARRFRTLSVAAIAGLHLMAGAPALGVNFIVNSFLDERDDIPGDGICQTPSGVCTLRAAIEELNALPPGAHTVMLPGGVYPIMIPGGGNNQNHAGDFDILTSMTVMALPGQIATIDAVGIDRGFDVHNNANVVLQDLMIRNGDPGFGAAPGTTSDHGGGVRNGGTGSLTLHNVVIENCRADLPGGSVSRGGAVYSSGALTIENCQMMGNVAKSGGGAVYVDGNAPSLTIVDSVFAGNTVFSGAGGAVNIAPTTTLAMIVNSSFDLNRASSGGGALRNRGSLTVMDSAIVNNQATSGSSGGAVTTAIGATTEIIRTTVHSNTADLAGGAINNGALAQMRIIDSTLAGNTATTSHGGAINNFGFVALVNSTVSGNMAPVGQGGALYNFFNSSAELSSATIANNVAMIGGGLFNGEPTVGPASMTLRNTLVADNFDSAGNIGSNFAGPSLVTSDRHNLDTDGSLLLADPTDQSGSILMPINAMLGPLQNNGGPTLTHELLPGSPAIDRANPFGVHDETGLVLAADQRGAGRPFDGDNDGVAISDIGAFETQVATSVCPADLNGDGLVNGADIATLLAQWNTSVPMTNPFASADFNQDGFVNGADLSFMLANFGACP